MEGKEDRKNKRRTSGMGMGRQRRTDRLSCQMTHVKWELVRRGEEMST
jgi:hypothetical protein